MSTTETSKSDVSENRRGVSDVEIDPIKDSLEGLRYGALQIMGGTDATLFVAFPTGKPEDASRIKEDRMTQVRKQTAVEGRRLRLPTITNWHLLGAIVVLWMAPPLSLEAQTPPPPVDAEAIYRRLEQQDAEIQWLRTRLSAGPGWAAGSPEFLATPAESTSAATAEFNELRSRVDAIEKAQAGPKADKPAADDWVGVSREKWTVKLGGHVQLDQILWAQASPQIDGDQNYVAFRRLRLVADGTGYGVYDFRLQMTLEPGSESTDPFYTAAVKDAYLSMNEIPGIGRMRIGNFFVPFSLEQVTNDTNNIFLERSIPTQGIFAADREIGMAIYNCTPDRNMTWAVGMFFDNISDNVKVRFDDNQGCRVSGRLTWLPYYDEPSNGRYLIHTGVGVLYTDDHDDLARFRARPQINQGPFLIDSGGLPADSYTTGNIEGAIVWGPVTVQSEAFLSSVHLDAVGPATIGGAYVHLSYFVTGENRIYERFGQHGAQFGRNVPFMNFLLFPGGAGWGAWEFKTRWSNLNLNNLDAGDYSDLTVGFNWYWSDRTRVMCDWIHPVTTAGARFGAAHADNIGMRFDFNW
ncbi:MAG: hypothetical protein J5I93_13860 [Pirellulaceae bacterium]|nr:hypothetical protein [Pirellulaceae bacterium]